MKFIYIFSLVILINISAFCQNYVIINDSVNGGFPINFTDTIISSSYGGPTGQNEYLFDLDNDSNFDIRFYLMLWMGGMGSYYQMWLSTFNSFNVIINPAFQSIGQYIDSNFQVQNYLKTYTIVKKYSNDDTIKFNEANQCSQTILTYIMIGTDPLVYYDNVTPFLHDTSYIAFYKQDTSSLSIYYLKIYALSKWTVNLISAKTNDKNYSLIKDNYLPQCKVYPNPFIRILTIEGNFEECNIYSIDGQLIFSDSICPEKSSIDLSFLKKGMYLLQVSNNEKTVTKKIIKI